LDEMSMVSLPMMARLLEATRSGTRVVLVGDPDQLTSVEAGAVMADVAGAAAAAPALRPDDVRLTALEQARADDRPETGRSQPVEVELAPVARGVVQLRHTWRFGAEIGALADALRAGRADDAVAVLRAGGEHLSWVETDLAASGTRGEPLAGLEPLRQAVLRSGRAVDAAARAGRAAEAVEALEQHRVLCAHRGGPFGVARWSRVVEGWLAEAVEGYGEGGEWYLGRPLLVTANDPDIGLYNGDTGVVVSTARGLQAAFSHGREPVLHPLIHLDAVQSVHAMTVHKAQGSQFAQVTFVVPPLDSALLTRELLYTAVTRARDRVEIIGTEDALRRAVERPANRASGLRHRL
uniref:AAA family ATPase n=1 Tax=Desertihabitans aurantiacus TaxID=2282477 RepID=UPI0013009BEC